MKLPELETILASIRARLGNEADNLVVTFGSEEHQQLQSAKLEQAFGPGGKTRQILRLSQKPLPEECDEGREVKKSLNRQRRF